MNVESHIGQYKLLRTLGSGGMGTVYLGEHILLGRRAAIKTLLPSLSSHREIVDRFFNEARAISAISDPGVVQIFDFGYHVDGTAYIVMEFLEGESLATRLDRQTKLPLAEALRITRQIAASLGNAHARGIIHRDLKPGNVFLIRDREAQGGERTKILDFGIAKLVSNPTELVTTQTGTMLGTPVYMSPEQCRGSGKVDHRSDIYSVGCALFHMLTGVPPFDCDSVGDYIAAHLREDPPKPSELAPELPPAVDALLMRCLEKRPEDRFQTMAELATACEDVLAHLSDSSREVVPLVNPKPATPLGDGFHSKFDINSGRSGRPTVDERPKSRPHSASSQPPERPSDPWFVDSLAPVTPSNLDDDDEWNPPERRLSPLQRIALVVALFIGVVGGMAGASYLMQDDTSVQSAALDVPATVDPLEPAAATAHEPVPPAAVAGSDEPELELDEVIEALEEAAPVTAPIVTPKPERPHPARTQPRPRARRPAVTPQVEEPQTEPEATPEANEEEEDLYDTR